MASIKRILRSYPWKNYKNFNWNELFVCPKVHFAWLKLALWSRIACFAPLNLSFFQWIFEHGYHDGIDQSHATVTHDQTWIRFGWEKLSFSSPDSIQEVWYGRNVMTPCDQGCYSQWGIAFYRVSHNYFINVAVLLTEQDIARCVYVNNVILPHVVQYADGLFTIKITAGVSRLIDWSVALEADIWFRFSLMLCRANQTLPGGVAIFLLS